ncbi:MAG TPA: chemotaxis protein CheW [bacterium]|nr:chemotaxis protein CheW [bacterium]
MEDSIEQMKLEFVASASEAVERLSRRLATTQDGEPYPRQLVDSVFRTAHSLRGTAGMFGFDEVSFLSGALENLLEALRAGELAGTSEAAALIVDVLDHIPLLLRNENDDEAKAASRRLAEAIRELLAGRPAPQAEKVSSVGEASAGPRETANVPDSEAGPATARADGDAVRRGAAQAAPPLSVKVDIAILDAIMNTVSELFSSQLALSGIARALPRNSATRRLGDDLLKTSYLVHKRMLDLEVSVIEARLVPMTMLFDRFSGEVRRLARRAGKAIDLVFLGEDTRIDRALLDSLYDPLLHIIRNAVDHGIEPSDERAASGKPVQGKIVLRAAQESSHVRIDVEDDGRGVDVGRVREVAEARGIAVDGLESAVDMIFEPGFSTKDRPNDISGRGVGLDAVKTQIEGLGGIVNLATAPGRGTSVSIWVPLTLAISRGIVVEEGAVPVAIPLGCIVEVLRADEALRSEASSVGFVDYRGDTLPVVALADMLGIAKPSAPRFVVVLGLGAKRRAILVERVLGETEIVSRPLPDVLAAPGFISGATELHNGRPAIVIQPAEVLRGQGEGTWQPIGPFWPTSPWNPAAYTSGSLRLVVVRRDESRYGLPFGCLKEILPESQVVDVPVLGRTWEGLFFVRGLCHGSIRLPGNCPAKPSSRVKIITLSCPERCGIRVDDAIGDCEIPLEAISPANQAEVPDTGSVPIAGTFKWMGRAVHLLAMPSPDARRALGPGCRNRSYAGLMPSP